MTEQSQFYVDVVSYEDGAVVKRLGPMAERKADKVDDGLNINLNHDKYYTLIVPVAEAGPA